MWMERYRRRSIRRQEAVMRKSATLGKLAARALAIASIIFLSVFVLAADANITPEEADRSFRTQDWKNAVAAYTQLTRSEPGNGRFWLRLGVSQIKLHDYKAALAALDKAEKLNFYPDRTRFELALAHAGVGDKEGA